jgi:hypothetical protein
MAEAAPILSQAIHQVRRHASTPSTSQVHRKRKNALSAPQTTSEAPLTRPR